MSSATVQDGAPASANGSSPASANGSSPRVKEKPRRVRTPTLIQMEAVECGAAALGIVLGYYGRFVPLEELRVACGVSRDGSKASNVVKAARAYGFEARGLKREPEKLKELRLPLIVFWNFNHFLVVEGFGKGKVYLNDPARGPRTVTAEEFDAGFTGVVLALEPGASFVRAGKKRSIVPALRERLAGSGPALAYVVLASLALVILALVVPAFTRVFVDQFLVGGLRGWLPSLLLAMLLTAGIVGAFTWLQQSYLLRLESKLAVSMSSKFFWHVLRLPAEFFTQRYAGDISSRVALNDAVARLLSGQLATNLLGAVLIVVYVLIMLQYDVVLTLLAVVAAAANVVALQLAARRRSDQAQRLLQDRGKMIGAAYNGLQLIESLKSGGRESDFFARWAGYQAKVLNGEQEVGVSNALLGVVPPLLSMLTMVSVLTIGGVRVIEGALTLGGLFAFQVLLFAFLAPVTQLVGLGSRLQQAEGELNRLEDVLRYPADPRVDLRPQAADAAGDSYKLTGRIDIRGLTFGYSRLEPPLIEDLNLSIRPGARVALVGGSGSGKSTVARLVVGLYRPWSGEILFDGKSREELPRTLIANSLAMVDQDISIFEGTIRENLTLWDGTIPETDIVQAAKDAHIHDEIAARQGGYDFPVEESGRNFSGGQRQRLEIARALASNPTILVLDEATSALDPIGEKIVDDNLRRRGCTCLIVAHRLSTIRDCDEIIVLERGKVVQRGTHEQMRRKGGPYARLMQLEESKKVSSLLEDL